MKINAWFQKIFNDQGKKRVANRCVSCNIEAKGEDLSKEIEEFSPGDGWTLVKFWEGG